MLSRGNGIDGASAPHRARARTCSTLVAARRGLEAHGFLEHHVDGQPEAVGVGEGDLLDPSGGSIPVIMPWQTAGSGPRTGGVVTLR